MLIAIVGSGCLGRGPLRLRQAQPERGQVCRFERRFALSLSKGEYEAARVERAAASRTRLTVKRIPLMHA